MTMFKAVGCLLLCLYVYMVVGAKEPGWRRAQRDAKPRLRQMRVTPGVQQEMEIATPAPPRSVLMRNTHTGEVRVRNATSDATAARLKRVVDEHEATAVDGDERRKRAFPSSEGTFRDTDETAFAGKLYFRSGSYYYVCSAAVIGPRHVLTAAHCVYDNEYDQWFDDFWFAPALTDSLEPRGSNGAQHEERFGQFEADYAVIWNAYADATTLSAAYDVAVLGFPSSFGQHTGSLAVVSDFPPVGNVLKHVGYPSETKVGYLPTWSVAPISWVTGTEARFDGYFEGGESGSVLFTGSGDNRRARCVMSLSNRYNRGWCGRVTAGVLADVQDLIQTAPPPVDRCQLTPWTPTSQSASPTSLPSTAVAGAPFRVRFSLRNVGEVACSSVRAQIRRSSDVYLGVTDPLLKDSVSFSSVAPGAIVDIDENVVIGSAMTTNVGFTIYTSSAQHNDRSDEFLLGSVTVDPDDGGGGGGGGGGTGPSKTFTGFWYLQGDATQCSGPITVSYTRILPVYGGGKKKQFLAHYRAGRKWRKFDGVLNNATPSTAAVVKEIPKKIPFRLRFFGKRITVTVNDVQVSCQNASGQTIQVNVS